MASSQDLRKRIKSVTSTQQITKAMKMVASARLNKAQFSAKAAGPYAEKLASILKNVVSATGHVNHPLVQQRIGNRKAYLIIGADKGLAGAYSSNLMKGVASIIKGMKKSDLSMITVGRKPYEYLRRYGYPISTSYKGFSDKPTYEDAVTVTDDVIKLFLDGQVDEVIMVYTYFINSLTSEVKVRKILPIAPEKEAEGTFRKEYLYAPAQEEIFEQLLPKVLAFSVYDGMLQSAASELAARMTAMTTASDNANQLIDDLNLQYNRIRQAQITNEISEIIGGANALQ